MSVHIQTLKALKESGKTPLVLLHGWGRTGQDFSALAASIAAERDTYIIDLPGFGRSPLPAETFGIAEYAEMLAATIPVERFSLLGHSVGGKISTVIAATYPARVEKLILLDASGLPRKRTLQERLTIQYITSLRNAIKFSDKNFGTKLFEKWFIPRFASPDYKNAGPLKNIFVRIVNQSVETYLSKINCPVLLLWGQNDPETPVDVGQSFNLKLPGSKLIVIPGVGHFPHLEGAESLVEYHLSKFL